VKLFLSILLSLNSVLFSQETTYSKKEIEMYRKANNLYIGELQKGDLNNLNKAAELFQDILKEFPNTIVKNGIINNLFDIKVRIYTHGSFEFIKKENLEYSSVSIIDNIKDLGALLIEIEPQHFNYNQVAYGFLKTGLFLNKALEYEKKAISKLLDFKNLHMPEYYYNLGKIYFQLDELDSALCSFLKADSIIKHIPDKTYKFINTKQFQETKIKLAIANIYFCLGRTSESIKIYKNLYTNNLNFKSIEKKYAQALLEMGIPIDEIQKKLDNERLKYLEGITFQIKHERINEKMKFFKLKDIEGNIVSITDYLGKVVVLNFWAGWCEPCLIEMPVFVKLQNTFEDFPVAILSINIEPPSNIKYYERIFAEYNINFKILNGNFQIKKDYNVPPIPKTFVIDKVGNIQFEHCGTSGSLYEILSAEVEELLKKGN